MLLWIKLNWIQLRKRKRDTRKSDRIERAYTKTKENVNPFVLVTL